MRATHGIAEWVSVVILVVAASPAVADMCPVPSAPHPTIQDAVEDLACTEVVLVAIGSDGLGLISYADGTNLDLKVAHLPIEF